MNLLLVLFTYISRFNSNLSNIKIDNDYKGYDYRYKLNETVNTLEYKHNFLRQFLLVELKKDNIDTFTKVQILDSYKDLLPEFDMSMKPNVTKGGLLDDWDFTI